MTPEKCNSGANRKAEAVNNQELQLLTLRMTKEILCTHPLVESKERRVYHDNLDVNKKHTRDKSLDLI